MEWLLADLFFIFFALFISPHIVLLDFLDEFNFRVVSVHDEFFVVSLGVKDTVDILEGDFEVLIF